jgi:putative ABC transport system ATP-binding protein
MNPIVQCQDVHKSYGRGNVRVHALRGLTMSVLPGEFTALAGPSGSGKTTLLNLIGRLDTCDGGGIAVAGRRLESLSEREATELRLRHIGFIFQAYNLIPVLSAQENVEYILLLQGVPAAERRRRARDILVEAGLDGLFARRPAELSGGQQQRVAVARAIVAAPALVLADEPTANLDSENGGALLDMMLDLNRHRKVTFLFSTHDPQVMERARRLLRLRDGRIQSDETRAAI